MATKKNARSEKLSRLRGFVELEKAYIIFSAIYFPVAWLFIGRGVLATWILVIYTALMFVATKLLLMRFLTFLAKASNEQNGKYGSVALMYAFAALFPLAMLKVFGYVVIRMLPRVHEGIVCDLVKIVKDVYYLFNYQTTLNWVIIISAAAVFGMALWNIGRGKK